MTCHMRQALVDAGLPLTPIRMSDHLHDRGRIAFLIEVAGITSKRCSHCKQEKPLTAFYEGDGAMERRSHCKACQSAYQLEYNRAARAKRRVA